MDYLLLSVAVLFFCTIQLSFKEFSRSIMKSAGGFFLFTFFHMSVALFVFLASGIRFGGLHIQTILVALPFGVFQLGVILSRSTSRPWTSSPS